MSVVEGPSGVPKRAFTASRVRDVICSRQSHEVDCWQAIQPGPGGESKLRANHNNQVFYPTPVFQGAPEETT